MSVGNHQNVLTVRRPLAGLAAFLTFIAALILPHGGVRAQQRVDGRTIDVDGDFRRGGKEDNLMDRGGRSDSNGNSSQQQRPQRSADPHGDTTIQVDSALQPIAYNYAAYAAMRGYLYSTNHGHHKIRALVPIDVFTEKVASASASKGQGLDAGDIDLVQSTRNIIQSGKFHPSLHQQAPVLENILASDRAAKQRRFDAMRAEQARQNDPRRRTPDEVAAFATDSRLDAALNAAADRRNLPPGQFAATAIYGTSHIGMALSVLNPHSSLGMRAAQLPSGTRTSLYQALLSVADDTGAFLAGTRQGMTAVALENIGGAVQVVKFSIAAAKNPSEAVDRLTETLASLDAEQIARQFAFAIEEGALQLRYGLPQERGVIFGRILANAALVYTSAKAATLLSGSPAALGTSTLGRAIPRMVSKFPGLLPGDLAAMSAHLSRIVGPLRSLEVIELAADIGMTTRGQLEGLGQFLGALVRSDAGAVLRIREHVRAYASYFSSLPKSGVIEAVLSADELNAAAVAAAGAGAVPQLSYQAGSMLLRVRLLGSEVAVRVHHGANRVGQWVTLRSEIAGMTPLQVKNHLNLPEIPTHISTITLRPGEELFVSRIGANAFGSGSGGTQIEVLRPLTGADFTNTVPLHGPN